MSKCCPASVKLLSWQHECCSPRQQRGTGALPHDNHNHKLWSWEAAWPVLFGCSSSLHRENGWRQCGSEWRESGVRFKSSANYWSVNTSQCEIGHRSWRSNDVRCFLVCKKMGKWRVHVWGTWYWCEKRLKVLLCQLLYFVHLYLSGRHIFTWKENIEMHLSC